MFQAAFQIYLWRSNLNLGDQAPAFSLSELDIYFTNNLVLFRLVPMTLAFRRFAADR